METMVIMMLMAKMMILKFYVKFYFAVRNILIAGFCALRALIDLLQLSALENTLLLLLLLMIMMMMIEGMVFNVELYFRMEFATFHHLIF